MQLLSSSSTRITVKGRHLSNINYPYSPDARSYFFYSYNAWCAGPRAMEIEWQHHMMWVESNILCLPKATPLYTQDKLIDMGMVGIYKPIRIIITNTTEIIVETN